MEGVNAADRLDLNKETDIISLLQQELADIPTIDIDTLSLQTILFATLWTDPPIEQDIKTCETLFKTALIMISPQTERVKHAFLSQPRNFQGSIVSEDHYTCPASIVEELTALRLLLYIGKSLYSGLSWALGVRGEPVNMLTQSSLKLWEDNWSSVEGNLERAFPDGFLSGVFPF